MSGRGSVYSWVVVRVPLTDALADQIPYAVGLIELKEGVRIVSTISGCAADAVYAGMPVVASFAETHRPSQAFSFIPA